MKKEVKLLLRAEFAAFVAKYFRVAHGVRKLDPYVPYLAAALQEFDEDDSERTLVLEMPPRHAKTTIASVLLTAWRMGRDPKRKVMVICHSEHLSTEITRMIRDVMRSDFYKETFPTTRISRDKRSAGYFKTTRGGSVMAKAINAHITGDGADFIVLDDLVEISDANNLRVLAAVNDRIDSTIRTRFNRPSKSKLMNVAHRTNPADPAGHLVANDNPSILRLPFIATEAKTYRARSVEWHRQEGELLRPDEFSEKLVAQIRASKHFESLFQQNPGAIAVPKITRNDFLLYNGPAPAEVPVVLSVDTGLRHGDKNSYSVIQAWCQRGAYFYLHDQWRERVFYDELRTQCHKRVKRYRASAILIERTGVGEALVRDMRRGSLEVIPIEVVKSKRERLLDCAQILLDRRVFIPELASWRNEFINEFVNFGTAPFTDQVDATTQYLQFTQGDPILRPRRQTAGQALVLASHMPRW